jgi:hypothetical protein
MGRKGSLNQISGHIFFEHKVNSDISVMAKRAMIRRGTA